MERLLIGVAFLFFSMTYVGIDRHKGEEKGLFDISISPETYKQVFGKTNICIDSNGISMTEEKS